MSLRPSHIKANTTDGFDVKVPLAYGLKCFWYLLRYAYQI